MKELAAVIEEIGESTNHVATSAERLVEVSNLA
ncbi:hypothetical protein J2S17_003989 [Cytobacillus purgationiresistens]|uniref:Methyl-accepting chemotaxis protein n=1 Tax=Cytobacillus purgationiresistens TaxID=863449 RepID=A0ABU0ALF7_9BACI|nr:hypothetical protein [Cytobacillus purgationiresistens]